MLVLCVDVCIFMAFNMHDDMRHVHLKRNQNILIQTRCGERGKSFQHVWLIK